jgi:formylglycine-generating enzyme required for sulfatase activity
MKKQRLIFMLATLALLLSIPGAASAVVDKKQDVKRNTSARFDQPMTIDAPDFKPSQPAVDKKGAQPSAQNASQVPQRATGETFTVNGVSFVMVPVQGGTYTRGATDGQGSEAMSSEKPAHPVTVASFSMGATEVTQELWQAVMEYNPSRFNGNVQCPVEMVSYLDCQAFIYRLNELTGRHFRLPTEAEWEYAARGGQYSNDFMYAGGTSPNPNAWYSDNSYETTHAVATKMPNELGLYDMSGNVAEWCQDAYLSYSSFGQDMPTSNPWGRDGSTYRVLRGGSALSPASMCRVSARNKADWAIRDFAVGFRLVLSDMQGANISFMQSSQQVDVSTSSVTVPVAITRGNTQGSYTTEVMVSADDISITPLQMETVTFADGQSVAYIDVPFQFMEYGTTYTCSLSLSAADAETANPEYGEQILSTTVSVTVGDNWVYAGTATFIDRIETSGNECTVQVMKAVGASQVKYRLVEPYQTLFANSSNAAYFANDGDIEFTLSLTGEPISVESGNLIEGTYEFYYDPVNYGNYCSFTREDTHYYVNGLLVYNGTPSYIASFEFIYDVNQSSMAAPATQKAVQPVSVPLRKKELVPFHEIKN